MIKNKYKDDYSPYERLNGKGRVVEDMRYIGDYYILPFSQEQKKKTGWYNLMYVSAILCIHIVAGLLNQDSSRTAWIVYPYLFAFLPMGYMFGGALGYLRSPLKMQKVQYETGIERMRRSCIGVMILTAFGFVLDILYIILHHSELAWGRELTYLLCHVAAFGVALLFAKYYSKTFGGITTQPSEHSME